MVSTLLSATQTFTIMHNRMLYIRVSTLLSATQTELPRQINGSEGYVSTLLSATQTQVHTHTAYSFSCFNPSKCYSNVIGQCVLLQTS